MTTLDIESFFLYAETINQKQKGNTMRNIYGEIQAKQTKRAIRYERGECLAFVALVALGTLTYCVLGSL